MDLPLSFRQVSLTILYQVILLKHLKNIGTNQADLDEKSSGACQLGLLVSVKALDVLKYAGKSVLFERLLQKFVAANDFIDHRHVGLDIGGLCGWSQKDGKGSKCSLFIFVGTSWCKNTARDKDIKELVGVLSIVECVAGFV